MNRHYFHTLQVIIYFTFYGSTFSSHHLSKTESNASSLLSGSIYSDTTPPTTQMTSVPQLLRYSTAEPTMQGKLIDQTKSPSSLATIVPSMQPTVTPMSQLTSFPSLNPSGAPSVVPSIHPTYSPSSNPSQRPSCTPKALPTQSPTNLPSVSSTQIPSGIPTKSPTFNPTLEGLHKFIHGPYFWPNTTE